MTQKERCKKLIEYLLDEMPQYKEQAKQFDTDETSQFRLFRSLVNVRPPKAAGSEFLRLQDEFLQSETEKKGITDFEDIPMISENICLWQGDITTLKCDAVVNAANSQMLGCFYPCHRCIDNSIHTFSGVQLRIACNKLMQEQGHEEPTGKAKITKAYNLPSKYVLHTVGPIIYNKLTQREEKQLASCYRSCLELAEGNNIESIAFCCISTGEFCFPNQRAAEIAINTVREYVTAVNRKIKVIFNVYKDEDFKIYRELFSTNQQAEK